MQNKKPLCSFGAITDVQYADIDNRHSYWGIERHYRNAINQLDTAITTWNEHDQHIDFAVHLGDIIDGFNPKNTTMDAFEKVLGVFNKFTKGPVYHLIGNHCLYNLSRDVLHPKLNIAPDSSKGAYYDFSPHPKCRFVVVDTYDISVLGWPEGHPKRKLATELLNNKNQNPDQNSSAGLVNEDQRWVKFNGALGKEQLDWLEGVLKDAKEKNQIVIVFSHVALHPGIEMLTTAWDYDEVLKLLYAHDNVKMVMSGHNHDGGYHMDRRGVHHIVLPGVIECEPTTNAYGTVHVYDDCIVVDGVGKVDSKKYKF